jgi:hypothetical protein
MGRALRRFMVPGIACLNHAPPVQWYSIEPDDDAGKISFRRCDLLEDHPRQIRLGWWLVWQVDKCRMDQSGTRMAGGRLEKAIMPHREKKSPPMPRRRAPPAGANRTARMATETVNSPPGQHLNVARFMYKLRRRQVTWVFTRRKWPSSGANVSAQLLHHQRIEK